MSATLAPITTPAPTAEFVSACTDAVSDQFEVRAFGRRGVTADPQEIEVELDHRGEAVPSLTVIKSCVVYHLDGYDYDAEGPVLLTLQTVGFRADGKLVASYLGELA